VSAELLVDTEECSAAADTQSNMFVVYGENALPQSKVGRPNFVESEQALKMTPGQNAHLTSCGNIIKQNRRVNVHQIADTEALAQVLLRRY